MERFMFTKEEDGCWDQRKGGMNLDCVIYMFNYLGQVVQPSWGLYFHLCKMGLQCHTR